ncbi:hypothetical protein HL666_09090 [Bradyrhizobium sp. 83002]|uniref:hypothetical protein n=1 Tax=Bradyrhizobium aeschynomenes TaxID=2734909 RepID=UPI001554EDBF|nr:hypothetical protein [Bradyrhizobium aeschynomenes]NPU10915.1 hypothetical protein [Bradyrhizobium aeschynomenes]
MADENRRFVDDFANPHSWLLMAESLHEQATALYRTRDRSSIVFKVDPNNAVLQQTRGLDKVVFLLGGFALENTIKAFLVYEHPHWISNGRLSANLKSHSLIKLQAQSSLIPYKKQYLWVLRSFETGLDSWFRYPCGLTIEDTEQERELHLSLWGGYERLMHAYGRRLTELFGKGWKGPHGFFGKWEMSGETLGFEKPLAVRRRGNS